MPFSVYLPESLRAAFKPELGHEFGKGHREHRLQPPQIWELARSLARCEMPDRLFSLVVAYVTAGYSSTTVYKSF
jgi:hypothetical protein